jgi:hypothetical protein
LVLGTRLAPSGSKGSLAITPFASLGLKTKAFGAPKEVDLSTGERLTVDLTPSLTIDHDFPLKEVDVGKVKAGLCGLVGLIPVCVPLRPRTLDTAACSCFTVRGPV